MNSTGEKLAVQGQDDEARREMLQAIREHLAASAPFDAVRNRHQAQQEGKTQASQRAAATREPDAALVERFRQAFEAVGGRCTVVRDEAEAAEAVERILRQTKARRIAVSNSPLVQRVIERVKSDAVLLENAAPAALFDCDLGITSAQWAAAETGTLVLESDQERHRLASLVPPAHLAIIAADRIRQTLGEVLHSLSEQGPDSLSRAVTFITGPSRTSDIELTLAIGVHGPAEVYVIILQGGVHD
jgi:L-lactate dehydrogenase complex protein LldG